MWRFASIKKTGAVVVRRKRKGGTRGIIQCEFEASLMAKDKEWHLEEEQLRVVACHCSVVRKFSA